MAFKNGANFFYINTFLTCHNPVINITDCSKNLLLLNGKSLVTQIRIINFFLKVVVQPLPMLAAGIVITITILAFYFYNPGMIHQTILPSISLPEVQIVNE